jgi:hypothetical protein
MRGGFIPRPSLPAKRAVRCGHLDQLLVLGDDRVQAARRQAADHFVVLEVLVVFCGLLCGRGGGACT